MSLYSCCACSSKFVDKDIFWALVDANMVKRLAGHLPNVEGDPGFLDHALQKPGDWRLGWFCEHCVTKILYHFSNNYLRPIDPEDADYMAATLLVGDTPIYTLAKDDIIDLDLCDDDESDSSEEEEAVEENDDEDYVEEEAVKEEE